MAREAASGRDAATAGGEAAAGAGTRLPAAGGCPRAPGGGGEAAEMARRRVSGGDGHYKKYEHQ